MSKYIHIESFALKELLRAYGHRNIRERAYKKESVSCSTYQDKSLDGFYKWHKPKPYKTHFNQLEKDYIKSSYAKGNVKNIANTLGRSTDVIYKFANLNGIRIYNKAA